MVDWILKNKEWIFSGGGVAVLAALGGWFLQRTWRKTAEPESERPQLATQHEALTDTDTETYWDRLLISKQQEPSKNLEDYAIRFKPECLEDLTQLGLAQEDLLRLIQSEFRSHVNYFRFDLEDYMMPVKARYIVYMDKTGNALEFKRVLPCTNNEAKLSSWEDILAIYRRATRLAYRDEPILLFKKRGQFGAASNMHLDIERRLAKHFSEYERLNVEPMRLKLPGEAQRLEEAETAGQEKGQRIAISVAFHLGRASAARLEGTNILKDLDNGFRQPETAVGDLVACLERSLQHIHKILVLFPPTENQTGISS